MFSHVLWEVKYWLEMCGQPTSAFSTKSLKTAFLLSSNDINKQTVLKYVYVPLFFILLLHVQIQFIFLYLLQAETNICSSFLEEYLCKM